MFHVILSILYIVPNIYAFLRIRRHFINRGYYWHYALAYLLVALIYPVDALFSEGHIGFQTGFFALLARYVLPFYLYMILSVLLFDLLLLANKFLHLVSLEKIKSTGFKAACLTGILVFAFCVVLAGILNYFTVRTTEYRVEIPRRSSKIDHLKIAFVADYHLKWSTDYLFVERFAKKIEQIHPDLMLFGGDIVEGEGTEHYYAKYERLLKGIRAPYGVFTVLGNHEHDGVQNKNRFFDHAGMQVLCDSVVIFDHAFNLAGRLDNHFRNRKSIHDLLLSAQDSLPTILIDHRPTDILEASKNRLDVQLSGHTHNGQLFPFNFLVRMIYPLSYGYKKIADTHFFVTSGIGLWGPTARTIGKSEIVVLDIEFK